MKKISLFIAVIMLFMMCSCTDDKITVVTKAPGDTSVVTSNDVQNLPLGGNEGEEILFEDDFYAVSFTVDGYLTGVSINHYLEGKNDVCINVEIYKWNIDYAKTVSASPVQKGPMVLMAGQGASAFAFTGVNTCPAGKYLVIFSSDEGGGIYSTDETEGVEYFKNGETFDKGLCVSATVKK